VTPGASLDAWYLIERRETLSSLAYTICWHRWRYRWRHWSVRFTSFARCRARRDSLAVEP